MRVGFNPGKDKVKKVDDFFHQVIMPVYIPNHEGYFKDSFKILKYSLESLFKTSHHRTYISVVNNGCCEIVVDYLQKLFKENKIQELTHSTNVGYVNAMLKGITGHKFALVTTADADVLFLNNWQKETYKVFEVFPKTGAICPTPTSKGLKFYTYNLFFDCIFSKKMSFTKVLNPLALKEFAKSIGNSDFYNSFHLDKYLTITKNDIKAVVGAGHYIVTYKGCIFNKLEEKYSDFVLGGGSDDILDKPVADQGYWRLSTEDNFAYHMGNSAEPWMEEILNALKDESSIVVNAPPLKELYSSRFCNFIKGRIFMRILINKAIWSSFLQYKGLNREASKNY